MQQEPVLVWGLFASMFVGNVILLVMNLPLAPVFASLLRIPYAYLYPLIIMFCVIGVYEVNNSIVDVWIMLIMGVVGYALKKFGFDPAPLVLGLVIAPLLEMSLRQSLIMSGGHWLIFLQRPALENIFAGTAQCLTAEGMFRTFSYVHSYPTRSAAELREYFAQLMTPRLMSLFGSSRRVLYLSSAAGALTYGAAAGVPRGVRRGVRAHLRV